MMIRTMTRPSAKPMIKSMVNPDSSGGGIDPVYEWVLNMSGSDVMTLPSEILIPAGQPLSGFFRVLDDSAPRVMWSGVTTPRSYSYISAGNIISPEADVIMVDGFVTSVFPSDGDMHKVEIKFSQDVYLGRFGLSHTGIFSLTGQIRDITLPSGEYFPVNDNAQTITGDMGTVMALTGGTWEEYEVSNV